MPEERPPEWLPDGWIMEVRTTRSGSKYRYFTSRLSGCIFRSKEEVMDYLNIEKAEVNNHQIVVHGGHLHDWLPHGWILEIRCRVSGTGVGQKYKCYLDPSTDSRFYSKEDVFQYLDGGKVRSPSSSQKRSSDTDMDDILAQFEYSPDGLPHGWVKEIRFRKSNLNKSGVRRDPYYTDPVTGYVFRSLKDSIHFINTGEISKYAFRPKDGHMNYLNSLEELSPHGPAKKLRSQGAAIRRCLFTRNLANSDQNMAIHGDGLPKQPQSPLTSDASTYCEDHVGLLCENQSDDGNERKTRNASMEVVQSAKPPVQPLEAKRERGREVSDPAIEDPMSNKPLLPSCGAPEDPFQQENLELTEKKSLELTSMSSKRSKRKSEVEKLLEYRPHIEGLEHVDDENKQLSVPEGQLLEVESKFLWSENKKLDPGAVKSSFPEEKHPFPVNQNSDEGIEKSGRSRSETEKATTGPRRASKRLAMLKTKHVPEVRNGIVSDSIGLIKQEPPMDLVLADEIGTGCVRSLTDGKDQAGAENWIEDKPGSPLTLPFEDLWSDPCIEFAFRTLTSDIPEFDDCMAIQDYFQHQLVSAQSSSPSGSGSSAVVNQFNSGKPVHPVQMEPQKDEKAPYLENGLDYVDKLNKDEKPCRSENAVRSGEKLKKENPDH